MFKLLIDTCVWLDIAKDSGQHTLLTALERLVEQRRVELLVPELVISEFSHNKARIVHDTTKGYATTLRRAKELVSEFGEKKKTRRALAEIDNVNFRVPTLGDAAVNSVGRIERLLAAGRRIATSDAVMLRAAQRAINKHAPFHRARNGMADAILIESYAEEIRAKAPRWTRYAFVTHNVLDFSVPNGDTRLPHPDFAPLFSKIRSVYCTNLGALLKRVDPDQLAEVEFEEEFDFEPRSGTEIFEISEDIAQKIWYDHHQLRQQQIAEGKIRIIPDAGFDPKTAQSTITESIWEGAKQSARRVEKRFGKDNLGPWTKFEWGMLNGKLSALRWCLGFEWDMLDT